MRIGITGASGFIAGSLIPLLLQRGHQCIAFSRDAHRLIDGCEETRAIASRSSPDVAGLDAIVNLAGESIQGLWTEAKKNRIRDSRIDLTRALVAAIPGSDVRVLVSGSATGFYGNRDDELLPESASRGEGFLADVTADWEKAATAAEVFGVRVARARIGFVIAANGGALTKIRPLFRLGLGGRLGSGRQWMPWVHIDDVCGILIHLLERQELSGPFNVVAPLPVTNRNFTRALADACHRPAFLPVPSFGLRLALGEFSSLVLDSTRAVPDRTLNSGYRFRQSDLKLALRSPPSS